MNNTQQPLLHKHAIIPGKEASRLRVVSCTFYEYKGINTPLYHYHMKYNSEDSFSVQCTLDFSHCFFSATSSRLVVGTNERFRKGKLSSHIFQ